MPSQTSPGLFGHGLDPTLEQHFRPLCAVLSQQEALNLQQEIRTHLQDIHRALQQNEFLDTDMAERLSIVLIKLLNEYDSYPERHQKLIVGAARYFVSPYDADPDTTSLLGLDDDTAVLNYVLDTIGKPELKVEL